MSFSARALGLALSFAAFSALAADEASRSLTLVGYVPPTTRLTLTPVTPMTLKSPTEDGLNSRGRRDLLRFTTIQNHAAGFRLTLDSKALAKAGYKVFFDDAPVAHGDAPVEVFRESGRRGREEHALSLEGPAVNVAAMPPLVLTLIQN